MSTQQAAGTETATHLQQDVKSLDQVIEYIGNFNRSGTAPPSGWDKACIAPLANLRAHLQDLVPMVQQFYGGTTSGR